MRALEQRQSLCVRTGARQGGAGLKLDGRVIGGKPRGFQPLRGCAGLLARGQHRAEMEMSERVVGLSCDYGTKGNFGGRPVVAKSVEGTEFILQMGVCGMSADELSEDRRSRAELPGGGERARVRLQNAVRKAATSDASGGKIGAEVGNGAGGIACLLVGESEIFLSGVVVGVGAQGEVQLADAVRKLAETDEHCSERAVALLGSRVQADDLGEAGLSGVEIAAAERRKTGAVSNVGLAQRGGLRAGRQGSRQHKGRKEYSAQQDEKKHCS